MDIKQNPDGTAGFYSDQEGKLLTKAGGPKTPVGGASATANFRGAITAAIPMLGQSSGSTFTAAIANIQLEPVDDIIITDAKIYISTTTPAATIDLGTAASAGLAASNLINGLSTNAPGIYDTQTNKGTSGKTSVYLAAGGYISCGAQATTTGTLAGTIYITYFKA